MKHEYLNGGEPLPAGHPHAGEIGIVLDFEDGRPHPQKIYAADNQAMTAKLVGMYGNTQARLTEEKMKTRALPRPEGTPQTPTAPVADQPLTVDQRMQLTAELGDPARAGKALLTLVKAETGVDLSKLGEKEASQEEVGRLRIASETFVRNNPDFVPNKVNANLLRDRAFARSGQITLESLQSAFEELKEDGVLQSGSQEQTPTARTDEPSAQHQERPGGNATSVRPSSLGGQRRSGAEPKLTYDDYLKMAETPEYEDRLRNEPGFSQKVNEAFEASQKVRRAG